MHPTQRDIEAIFRNDLSSFIQKSFQTANPGIKYLHNWHIDLIAEYLVACEKGEINRLIINIPPRMMKSLSVSVAWPAWLLGHNPSRRIIAASYSNGLSIKHSQDCRLIITSDWYKRLFPWMEITADQNEKSKFVTTHRGMRLATSVGGTLTGEGGNFLIVDDPHNPVDIHSETIRKSTLDWFGQTFASRLDDKKRGVFVVVMQRLHQNDLSGFLLSTGGWEHLSIPAVAEKKIIIKFGKFNKIREQNELLHEEREGDQQIKAAKKELGSFAFAAQYQQNPVPASGGMIKPEWIKHYNAKPANLERITQSWDTAIKSSAGSDYSVCTTWGETENSFYLLDLVKLRAEFPELKRNVILAAEKWSPATILIEDKASGQSLLQDLRRETKLPLIAIMPHKDKVTRMAAVSSLIEAGRVSFPSRAAWLADLETELFQFPASPHDDQVDSISQYLNWTKNRISIVPTLRKL